MKNSELILILDFGSQYTQLIARRIRESRVYSEIHPFNLHISEIEKLNPKAIILSGGPMSVYDEGAPWINPEIFQIGCSHFGNLLWNADYSKVFRRRS